MTDPWADALDGPDPDEEFGDLVEVVRSVFDVRRDGSEVEWAAWAWRVLGGSRLTAAGTEIERGVVVLRLLALNAFYREFCALAFDEGESGEWAVDPDRAVGDYPRLHPVLVGVLAERRSVVLDEELGLDFDHAVTAAAVDGLVRTEYRTVVGALRADSGGPAGLFASLVATRESDVRYPLDDATAAEVLGGELTFGMNAAWQWLGKGAPLV
ncbi:hypothetical protein EV383_4064 [Pseudonocardia sediminis]|uniref:Uncharacterized protein n=1 Tax=Pseudonocardia sediminis TaxID=1397368 RepID=A0A4Q7UYX9_PSEST|nr:hypothetical protein [Pseudonocardia sediminis]RZT87156.1 hypothetical protein EV383_4064 [Pseudonocardia sediminis]